MEIHGIHLKKYIMRQERDSCKKKEEKNHNKAHNLTFPFAFYLRINETTTHICMFVR